MPLDLLLVRHGVAEEPSEASAAGRSDAARELTPDGRRRFRKAARGLSRALAGLNRVASSPLLRARQTAVLLGKAFDVEPEYLPALAPGGEARAVLAWLGRKSGTIALVGHEPDLSRFAGLLLCGSARSLLELRKGGACLIRCSDKPGPGRGTLLWLLKPSQLRRGS